jgi:hypothetical protein
MTSMSGAIRKCTRILWPGKASDKTPRDVFPPEIPQNASKKKENKYKFVPFGYGSKATRSKLFTKLFFPKSF